MPDTPRRKRHVLPPKARTLVRVLTLGAIAAVVILGVGMAMNLLEPKNVAERPSVPTVERGMADYKAGIAALDSGETTRAIELLNKAAAAGNVPARKKLAAISKPSTTAPSAVASDTFSSKVADMATLLPRKVAGYALAEVEKSTASAIVSAEPAPGGPSSISRLVFTVFDKKSSAAAAAWLSDFPKAYPAPVTDVTVADVPARFGTDGAHLAAVSFVRGRFGFEVVATATSGDPKQLRALVIQAASALSAAHTD